MKLPRIDVGFRFYIPQGCYRERSRSALALIPCSHGALFRPQTSTSQQSSRLLYQQKAQTRQLRTKYTRDLIKLYKSHHGFAFKHPQIRLQRWRQLQLGRSCKLFPSRELSWPQSQSTCWTMAKGSRLGLVRQS